jgi:hypothetical protein
VATEDNSSFYEQSKRPILGRKFIVDAHFNGHGFIDI